MSEKGIEIHTGLQPGRIVWGHPMKSRDKTDQQTKQPILKDGQKIPQWAFGVAWPKAYFQEHIWPTMAAEATSGYPNGVPQRFSYKYQDGDGVDSNGQPFSAREGYAGNIVLTISTELKCPEVFKLAPGGASYIQVQPDEIKTGDYVACALNFKVHVATGTHTPSLYVNPVAVELVASGTEIISVGAVDPMKALGGRTYALPPGAQPLGAPPMVQPGVGMPGTSVAPPTPPAGMPGAPTPGYPAAPPVMAPPPSPGPQRPVDPSHIQMGGDGKEYWWNGANWTPAPPPAYDFVPGMTAPAAGPGGMPMPGMVAPR